MIVLKEYQDLTFLEIAEALDVPVSTVKTRLYRGLTQLKQRLVRQGIRARRPFRRPRTDENETRRRDVMDCDAFRDDLMDVRYGEADPPTAHRFQETRRAAPRAARRCVAAPRTPGPRRLGAGTAGRLAGEAVAPTVLPGGSRSGAPRRIRWRRSGAGEGRATLPNRTDRVPRGGPRARSRRSATAAARAGEGRHQQALLDVLKAAQPASAAPADRDGAPAQVARLVRESETKQTAIFAASLNDLADRTETQRRVDFDRTIARACRSSTPRPTCRHEDHQSHRPRGPGVAAGQVMGLRFPGRHGRGGRRVARRRRPPRRRRRRQRRAHGPGNPRPRPRQRGPRGQPARARRCLSARRPRGYRIVGFGAMFILSPRTLRVPKPQPTAEERDAAAEALAQRLLAVSRRRYASSSRTPAPSA